MLNKLLGIVDNASEHGYQVDQMLEFVHWIMLLLFVGWTTFFIFTLIRFHKSRKAKADYHGVKSKVSTHLEFMVVLVESVFLLGFGIPLWGKRVNGVKPGQDAERIRVVGEQFLWNFHYPGKDGVFGRQKTELVTSSNPLGLDFTDPAALDDLVTKTEVHLPVNKNVILDITSKDVIHSLSLQYMRIGQDAMPGMSVPMWFKPIKTGSFEIVCGQLCGANHYAMRGLMVVETPQEYEEWKTELASLNKHTAPAPAATPAAAPSTPVSSAPASPEAAPGASVEGGAK